MAEERSRFEPASEVRDRGRREGEALGLAAQTGHRAGMVDLIERCGYLGAATGRWADAATLWAVYRADLKRRGRTDGPVSDHRQEEYVRRVEKELTPGQLSDAEERGAKMTVSAAAEFAIMVATAAEEGSRAPARGMRLSPRERELVTLVAEGHTNAQMAARLDISVRTVTSHLDRIRDKTGYRRRADLTRLALSEGLV